MDTSFSAKAFVENAAYKARLDGFNIYVKAAVDHLHAKPALATANSDLNELNWSTQVDSQDSDKPYLIMLTPAGVVMAVIYGEGYQAMAACEKAMPEEIVKAIGDMLACLADGHEAWIRNTRADVHGAFDLIFADTKKIAWDESWANGTGYMDGAVQTQVEGPKSFFDPQGRRGILLPCATEKHQAHCVVVFERYAGNEDTPLVYNAPSGYLACGSGLVMDMPHLHQLMMQAADATVGENA